MYLLYEYGKETYWIVNTEMKFESYYSGIYKHNNEFYFDRRLEYRGWIELAKYKNNHIGVIQRLINTELLIQKVNKHKDLKTFLKVMLEELI